MKTREEIAAYGRAYREANRERLAACDRERRKKNSEKRKAQARVWRESRKTLSQEQQRAWRECNPETVKRNNVAYYAKHRESQLAKASENYSLNKTSILARERERRRTDPARIMFLAARSRAKNSGLAFDLEMADVVIPAVCPVFGVEMMRGGRRTDATPTLDRIDNSKGYVKGYVKGNVQVISWRANRLKGNATVADIKRLLEYMTR